MRNKSRKTKFREHDGGVEKLKFLSPYVMHDFDNFFLCSLLTKSTPDNSGADISTCLRAKLLEI